MSRVDTMASVDCIGWIVFVLEPIEGRNFAFASSRTLGLPENELNRISRAKHFEIKRREGGGLHVLPWARVMKGRSATNMIQLPVVSLLSIKP